MQVIMGYALLGIGAVCGSLYGKKRNWPYSKYFRIAAITAGLCFLVGSMEQLGGNKIFLEQIPRNAVGKGSKDLSMFLEIDGKLKQEYMISVEEQRLTEKQATELFAHAKQELETVILGENTSLEQISNHLHIPSALVQGQVSVSCSFSPYRLIGTDGSIQWEKMEGDKELVKVTAQMNCQEWEAVHEFYLQLVLPNYDEEELLEKEIVMRLQKENQVQGKAYLELPQEVYGKKLHWYQKKEALHTKILLLGMILMICWYVYEKEKREQKEKARTKGLLIDYPNIVSQLSLLLGAGLTIPAAWTKMVQEYKEKRDKCLQPGYEEMLKTWHEMQDGVGEIKAYENFGIRCGLPQYRKFASLLMQNTRKGTKGMQQLLDMEAKEAFQQRRLYAQRLGQEAGTKLLIPMGIMLVLVFAILMLPAMLSLNIS